ncbi:MAG: LysR family transcriptional regulator [Clostridiales Family XIII bacterium]|jgi:DNA-binding transcriptional LysR family regulator|nr:LysR family transcriptional regulator [Clostridiales Family XIII bacterium]
MTITQLRYFLSICEFGKIRTSSEHLHVSEPTISVSVKRLEEELGALLFVRDKKQLILTENGIRLREKAAKIVESFDRLEAEMRQSQKKPSVIRLGASSTFGEHLCSRLISEFMEKYPLILFELLPLSSVDAVQQVMDEKIELAICDQLAVTSKKLIFSLIVHTTLAGHVRNDHPLAGRKDVTAQTLKDEKLIMLSEKAIISREIIRWFNEANAEPNLFMYSNRPSFSISMVKRYNAVSFFLSGLLSESEQVWMFPPENRFELAPPLCFDIGIVRKRGLTLTKAAQRFFDFCSNRAPI